MDEEELRRLSARGASLEFDDPSRTKLSEAIFGLVENFWTQLSEKKAYETSKNESDKVRRQTNRSVTFYFFITLIFLTSLLLPKWSCDLKYGPCLPARDFGSRVSGLFVPFVCLEHYFQSANFVSVRYVSILSVLDAELSCLQCLLIWQCNEPACWMAICKLDTF